jgi:hypothetical protein
VKNNENKGSQIGHTKKICLKKHFSRPAWAGFKTVEEKIVRLG